MSRRQVILQQQDEELAANPTLIEDRSRIDVGQDARGRYVLEVTEAGSDPVQSDPSKLALDNLVSIGSSIEGPGVELDAYTTYTFWGREFEGRGYVALSDLGAGVSSTASRSSRCARGPSSRCRWT